MSKLRISASKTFALEMVRAALFSSNIPSEYRLTGLWMHMDMEMGNDANKLVSLLIMIHDAPSQVRAECSIKAEGGVWVRGTCKISLTDDPSQHWEFDCRVEDSHIIATPSIAPRASV